MGGAAELSNKMILKRGLFPTQDDPENGRLGVGVQQPDANAHAERRGSEPTADQRISEGQRRYPVFGAKSSRDLCLDRAVAGSSVIHPAGQEAAGSDPALPEEGNGAEPAADHAADSEPRENRQSGGQGVPAAAVSKQVHRARHRAAGSRTFTRVSIVKRRH